MGVESKQHEKNLTEAIAKLEREGYRVVRTNRKIPDAIAVKDGKIYAVEMMGQTWRSSKGWVNKASKISKKKSYSGYDDMLYFTFRYDRKEQLKERRFYASVQDLEDQKAMDELFNAVIKKKDSI